MGAVVSAEGVLLSFYLDLPTGATIVAAFGATLLVVAAGRLLWRGVPNRSPKEATWR
jgi:ABC-type Mn2+/Zn2+ transport system permease subunit